jgi:Protein of unknown function (DUF732)
LVLLFGGLAWAGPAIAQPDLTQAETDFGGAVAPQGYSGDVYGTVQAGYRVCSLLDKGMSHEGIERFVNDTFNDRPNNAGYYASLFAQYATYHLCPRHLDEYGPI